MKLHWVAVAACLFVHSFGHPVSDSTPDTFVVAITQRQEAEKVTTEQTVLSSDGPTPPIKLLEMEVSSTVSLRYAHTLVMARVKNPAQRAQEAHFRVLLPETAFISGFIMTLDDKPYKAFVKEKEEAKQIYDQAVSQGLGAAHVQAKARDSNQFVVSVNVEPSSTAVFNLTYEELLIRRDGVYHHSLNLHPGALVPKLSVTVHIKETQKITELRVPEIRTGNEIDATKDDAQNTKAVIERANDEREAIVKFMPDLDEQLRLMEVYEDKSKESASKHTVTGQNNVDNKTQGVLGQFVVQYDVAHPQDGEVLVNDGYFVHFFAPSNLAPLPKLVVFVLDTSGSMSGRKIAQLLEAMQTILSNLNPKDFFHIVEFSSTATVHDISEASGTPRPQPVPRRGVVRVPPAPASAENIAKAESIVSQLEASGSTNIIRGLDIAVDLINARTNWCKKNDTTSTSTEVLDEGASLYPQLFEFERLQSLEPIIIFLTDGQANVDLSDPTAIVNQITEKITARKEKITIFSLAFGNYADHKFLQKLSLRNNGFMRHIYEAADAALQLQDFYRRVSSPLLADVHFLYPDTQVQESSVTKNDFRNYYAGSELVVAGKMAEATSEVTAQVISFCKRVNTLRKERCETSLRAKSQEYFPLERLWSYLTIKQLLDKKDASDDKVINEDCSKKALELALKYEFVTPLTSLVVVKPNATSAVNAESVDKPNTTHRPRGRGRTRSRTSSRIQIDLPLSETSAPVARQPVDMKPNFRSRELYSTVAQRYLPDNSSSTNDSSNNFSVPSATPYSPLQLYHLQEYSWIESLLNYSDEFLFHVQNETFIYKLTRDRQAPHPSGSESTCTAAVGGGDGRCVYLTRCVTAKNISLTTYATTHCYVDGFAGICCNEKYINETDASPSE